MNFESAFHRHLFFSNKISFVEYFQSYRETLSYICSINLLHVREGNTTDKLL